MTSRLQLLSFLSSLRTHRLALGAVAADDYDMLVYWYDRKYSISRGVRGSWRWRVAQCGLGLGVGEDGTHKLPSEGEERKGQRKAGGTGYQFPLTRLFKTTEVYCVSSLNAGGTLSRCQQCCAV